MRWKPDRNCRRCSAQGVYQIGPKLVQCSCLLGPVYSRIIRIDGDLNAYDEDDEFICTLTDEGVETLWDLADELIVEDKQGRIKWHKEDPTMRGGGPASEKQG